MIYDVIIAGAGPVGLFLACELRLAKLAVLVLEQAADPDSPLKRLPFGMRGLWGPSIEAFYRRGLLEQITPPRRADDRAPGQPSPGAISSGSPVRGPAGHFAGIQFDYSNIDSSRWTYRLPGPADSQCRVEIEQFERVLAAHALAIGVEIRRGHGIASFEPSSAEITVRVGEQRSRNRCQFKRPFELTPILALIESPIPEIRPPASLVTDSVFFPASLESAWEKNFPRIP